MHSFIDRTDEISKYINVECLSNTTILIGKFSWKELVHRLRIK